MSESTLLVRDIRISPENTVTKSNLLIDSNYRLSVLEAKLMSALFSNVQPSDQDLNTYIFPIKEFTNLLELKGKSKYKDLRVITKSLMERVFEIKIGDELHQVSWLSYVQYNEKKGSITLRFDSFWRPYILQLKRNFTSYKLGNITNLKSSYSIRLYELLKQRQGLKTRTFRLDELREKLGLPEDIYPRYANLKQRVLLTAQKELRANSDISFDFLEIKQGRSVVEIEFKILENKIFIPVPVEKAPIEQSPSQKNSVLSDLLKIGLTKEDAVSISNLYSKDRINENLQYTQEMMKKGTVKKPAAYLKHAIEGDFATTKKKEEKLPEWWENNRHANKVASKHFMSPKAKEKALLEGLLLMQSLEKTDEEIYNDLATMMKVYQQENIHLHGELVHHTEFTDLYVKNLCKDVTIELTREGKGK